MAIIMGEQKMRDKRQNSAACDRPQRPASHLWGHDGVVSAKNRLIWHASNCATITHLSRRGDSLGARP